MWLPSLRKASPLSSSIRTIFLSMRVSALKLESDIATGLLVFDYSRVEIPSRIEVA